MRVLLVGRTESIDSHLAETDAAPGDFLVLEGVPADATAPDRDYPTRTFHLAGLEAPRTVVRTQARAPFVRHLMEGRPAAVHLLEVDHWTLELACIASLFRLPVLLDVAGHSGLLAEPEALPRVGEILARTEAFRAREGEPVPDVVPRQRLLDASTPLPDLYAALSKGAAPAPGGLDYSLYEFGLREQDVIEAFQAPDVQRFQGCRRVLDIACGPGVFLEMLRESGIHAEGVERSPEAVGYARGLGLTIHEEDVLAFMGSHPASYDGVYCSHFIEHLPFDAVRTLVAGVAEVLQPGGRAVFVFPNPESIRSQLLGFWRDPEHVRFYHPALVALLAASEGLDVVEGGESREVGPFPPHPPVRANAGSGVHGQPGAADEHSTGGWWRAALRRLGILPGRDTLAHVRRLDARLDSLEARLSRAERDRQQLWEAIEALWSVNATWHWEDNATLVLHKPSDP